MRRTISLHLAPLLAALALASAAAVSHANTPAAAAEGMNFQQVIERVVAQGYKDVREVERKSGKLYEIKARNAQGRWVELYVDSRSGEILREKAK